jgi:hypothetical protein
MLQLCGDIFTGHLKDRHMVGIKRMKLECNGNLFCCGYYLLSPSYSFAYYLKVLVDCRFSLSLCSVILQTQHFLTGDITPEFQVFTLAVFTARWNLEDSGPE